MSPFPHHRAGRERPAAHVEAMRLRGQVTLRPARADDAPALERLEALAGRPLPERPLTVAETEDGIVAAAGDGALVVDPFAVTADLVALLELRHEQLAAA